MKLPRRLALTALLGVPLALFFVASRADQQRPWKLGMQEDCDYLAFSPDGQIVVSSTWSDGATISSTTAFWNSRTGQQLHVAKAQGDSPERLFIFSSDGKQVARFQNFRPAHLPATSNPPTTHTSSTLLISTIEGRTEKRFSLPRPCSSDCGADRITDAVWTANGHEIISITNHHIRHINPQNGHVQNDFRFRNPTSKTIGSAAYLSPSGQIAGYVEEPNRVILLDTHTYARLGAIPFPRNASNFVLKFSSKSTVAAADDGLDVQFVSLSNYKRLWT